jgi:hypothetical protein
MAASPEIVHERAHEPIRRYSKVGFHTAPAATSSVYAAAHAASSHSASTRDASDAAASACVHPAGRRRAAEEKLDAMGPRRMRLSRSYLNYRRDYLLDALSRETGRKRISDQR